MKTPDHSSLSPDALIWKKRFDDLLMWVIVVAVILIGVFLWYDYDRKIEIVSLKARAMVSELELQRVKLDLGESRLGEIGH